MGCPKIHEWYEWVAAKVVVTRGPDGVDALES